MRRIRLTDPARRDIFRALQRRSDDSGPQARVRYRRLLDQALIDLGKDPNRVGARSIDDVHNGCFTYHIKSGIESAPKPPVRQPRHLFMFYVDGAGGVIVAREFHERRMLSRHLAADDEP